jgi:predicted cupin superfamily sugar epimerase
MALPSAQSWIERLQMNSHIEGGWYKETYRSDLQFDQSQLPAGFQGKRNACTHIYFLLEKEQFSAFHKIRSDEIWHFYSGDPLVVYEIGDDGLLTEHILGNDPTQECSLSCVIKAGNWFASKVRNGGQYSLVGCTVAPGFDFVDFEMAAKGKLIAEYPQHRDLIIALCSD